VSAKSTFKKGFPVILLTIVVAISVSLLSFTDSITRDKIEAQEEEKIQTMLSEMFPDMSRYELEDGIYTIYSDGDEISYAFIAIGKGYGGDINILVGLEDENTIKDITIISQTETPGLGTRITESFFTDQFTGVHIDDVAEKRDGGQIDAITSSTVSSMAVIEAVKETAMEKVKLIKERE